MRKTGHQTASSMMLIIVIHQLVVSGVGCCLDYSKSESGDTTGEHYNATRIKLQKKQVQIPQADTLGVHENTKHTTLVNKEEAKEAKWRK